ncbi:hypothetical protein PCANC_08316 [Puccinia coronata f. sp. avenae]|uniref:Uncharacterized protein n=1 Tax=Puccinia coronata f. sp. avenae TaxID=200324 RepID=A0A2N5T4M3_9BASI|nr:hypothetical protein PCANC_08316 [Puccinia coronata f. sp. avenae]
MSSGCSYRQAIPESAPPARRHFLKAANFYPSSNPLKRRTKEPCNNRANNKQKGKDDVNDVTPIDDDQRSQSSSALNKANVNKLDSRIQPQQKADRRGLNNYYKDLK